MSYIEKIKLILLHIFFPNRCLLCDEVTFYNRIFCDDCVGNHEIITEQTRFDTEFCECYSPFLYSDGARIALLSFKYENHYKQDKARKFALSMVHCLAINNVIFDFDVIMYIPKYREKSNTFNSSYELAKRISNITNKPILYNVLVKIKKTQKQHRSKYEDRYTNLIGAFHCTTPQAISGKRILLIDDVCTSGSTFNTCAHTLLYFGANKVMAVSATTTYDKTKNKYN